MNGGGSGWSIEGRKKYDELFMAVKTNRKKHSKQFNPQLLLSFQARRRHEHQAKHNAKDDARPKAKAAYHCMNELAAEDSDEEEMGNDNDESSEDEDDDHGDQNNNGNRKINVYKM